MKGKEKLLGFTIIEAIVGVAIFAIIAAGVLGIFSILTRNVKVARERAVVASLASSYLELVRNMPYSLVGTINGNPNGTLADFSNPIIQNIEATTYKIFYEVTYIDDPADGTILAGTDSAPDDYKQVKMSIVNNSTNQINYFVTSVSPKGLEGTTNAGALLIKVFDSNGQPIAGANIHITYPTTTPAVILDRQSDSTGQWIEVGLQAAVNNYHIVVSKVGYSTDQTYALTGANPNPTKPDPTIVNGQVTQVSFSIDLLSNLSIKTLDSLCHALSSVNMNVSGAKLIGTSPNVLKFNSNFGSTAGVVGLANLEWDTYTPTLLSGQSVIVRGTSPIQQIDVLPNTSQTFTMILGPNSTPNSLLVIVKDASTGSALENASVTLNDNGTLVGTDITGGSVWTQNDWSGSGGIADWNSNNPNNYFQNDGNVDVSSAGSIKLNKISGNYALSGSLESAAFDTGTSASNYTILSWQPTSQSASTTVQFQVAANNDDSTWNYVGPDGTAATYFTTPGVDMGSSLDNKRFVRYKVFLSTLDQSKTPVLTSVNVNFVTGCFTPGQVIFTDLNAGSNYSLNVSLSGYTTQNISSLNINGNQILQVLMSP